MVETEYKSALGKKLQAVAEAKKAVHADRKTKSVSAKTGTITENGKVVGNIYSGFYGTWRAGGGGQAQDVLVKAAMKEKTVEEQRVAVERKAEEMGLIQKRQVKPRQVIREKQKAVQTTGPKSYKTVKVYSPSENKFYEVSGSKEYIREQTVMIGRRSRQLRESGEPGYAGRFVKYEGGMTPEQVAVMREGERRKPEFVFESKEKPRVTLVLPEGVSSEAAKTANLLGVSVKDVVSYEREGDVFRLEHRDPVTSRSEVLTGSSVDLGLAPKTIVGRAKQAVSLVGGMFKSKFEREPETVYLREKPVVRADDFLVPAYKRKKIVQETFGRYPRLRKGEVLSRVEDVSSAFYSTSFDVLKSGFDVATDFGEYVSETIKRSSVGPQAQKIVREFEFKPMVFGVPKKELPGIRPFGKVVSGEVSPKQAKERVAVTGAFLEQQVLEFGLLFGAGKVVKSFGQATGILADVGGAVIPVTEGVVVGSALAGAKTFSKVVLPRIPKGSLRSGYQYVAGISGKGLLPVYFGYQGLKAGEQVRELMKVNDVKGMKQFSVRAAAGLAAFSFGAEAGVKGFVQVSKPVAVKFGYEPSDIGLKLESGRGIEEISKEFKAERGQLLGQVESLRGYTPKVGVFDLSVVKALPTKAHRKATFEIAGKLKHLELGGSGVIEAGMVGKLSKRPADIDWYSPVKFISSDLKFALETYKRHGIKSKIEGKGIIDLKTGEKMIEIHPIESASGFSLYGNIRRGALGYGESYKKYLTTTELALGRGKLEPGKIIDPVLKEIADIGTELGGYIGGSSAVTLQARGFRQPKDIELYFKGITEAQFKSKVITLKEKIKTKEVKIEGVGKSVKLIDVKTGMELSDVALRLKPEKIIKVGKYKVRSIEDIMKDKEGFLKNVSDFSKPKEYEKLAKTVFDLQSMNKLLYAEAEKISIKIASPYPMAARKVLGGFETARGKKVERYSKDIPAAVQYLGDVLKVRAVETGISVPVLKQYKQWQWGKKYFELQAFKEQLVRSRVQPQPFFPLKKAPLFKSEWFREAKVMKLLGEKGYFVSTKTYLPYGFLKTGKGKQLFVGYPLSLKYKEFSARSIPKDLYYLKKEKPYVPYMVLKVPSYPGVPGYPKVPGYPGISKVPSYPGVPGYPKVPGYPGISKVPRTPPYPRLFPDKQEKVISGLIQKDVQAFKAVITARGKSSIETGPLTRLGALQAGILRTGRTAKRTFKVVPVEGIPKRVRKLIDVKRKLRVEYRKPFRLGVEQLHSQKWVEKIRFAIDTQEELQEISFKGLRTVRKKRGVRKKRK